MMKQLCTLLCLWALPCLLWAQKQDTHLFGVVTRDSLHKEPHATWFKKNYDDYQPTPSVIEQLKQLKFNDLSIKIFFGTWCGDTKRELPRLLKVLDAINFPKEKITFIALSSDEKTYKQSKNREEKGYHIFRVGSYVMEKNGVELNRIVEYPIFSMEQDILTIFLGENYKPQYFSYPIIIKWLKGGQLSDDNISAQNLASQLKHHINSSNELNACGYVLMADGKAKEAVKLFRINTILFPENSNMWHSLAEGVYRLGDKEKALALLEYGLQINKDPNLVKEFLDLHKKILTK
jgi:tetratricopeptide (TPR) repeat protein